MKDFMTSAEVYEKKDLKTEKKLWGRLNSLKKKQKFTLDNTKHFKAVQNVTAGYIREGYAFH
jgi:hypothetical protein